MALDSLNQEQFQSATTDLGYNLVIASAGTGKTSTIVGRIEYLISKLGVEPSKILLLTFTNKASKEMIERVSTILSSEVASQIKAGTFHSICYHYLKEVDKNLVLKTTGEILTLFRSVYEKFNFNPDYESGVVPYSAKYLYETYSFFQNVELEKYFGDWIDEEKPEQATYADIYQLIVDEFEVLKERYGYMSFNDLLIRMKKNLKKNRPEYVEILVDEYQDTNLLQDSIIQELKPKSLFCVGDYDQSIYAFNGANIEIIGNFSKRFKNAKVYSLKKNYRSTKPILDLADTVIKKNERLYPKELEVTKNSFSAPKPKLLAYSDVQTQYREISRLISNSITPNDKIAVLFRNNSSADGIEVYLRALGIPVLKRSGRSFFDSKEIQAVLNLYTFLVKQNDMMAFIHIFEHFRGVGASTAKELFEGLETLGNGSIYRGFFSPKQIDNPFNKREVVSHQLLLDFDELHSVSKFSHLDLPEKFLNNPILKHSKLSDEVVYLLFGVAELLKSFKSLNTPFKVIDKIANHKVLQTIFKSLIRSRSKLSNGSFSKELEEQATKNLVGRVRNLKYLSQRYDDHFDFLNAVILGGSEATQGEGVNLLTVHSSKGLEFDEVYIIDLMEGRFPNSKLASKNVGKIKGIEEERRLFYVAVTRARTKLFLSYAKYSDEDKKYFDPSQFLIEGKLL